MINTLSHVKVQEPALYQSGKSCSLNSKKHILVANLYSSKLEIKIPHSKDNINMLTKEQTDRFLESWKLIMSISTNYLSFHLSQFYVPVLTFYILFLLILTCYYFLQFLLILTYSYTSLVFINIQITKATNENSRTHNESNTGRKHKNTTHSQANEIKNMTYKI